MCQLIIVDDETSVVDSLALTIPWDDYGIKAVHRAYSAQEALQIAAEQTIDIMITDIQMPEMNGFDLNEKMRTICPRLKTIIISGYDDFKYAQKAIRQQTIDYLLKPVNIRQLIKTVENLVRTIDKEVKETISIQQIKHTLDLNMPMLKSQILNDLLENETSDHMGLGKKLALLDSFKLDDLFTMLVIRLEEGFSGYELQSISLVEFAVNNIAEEVFQDLFELWNCITDQGYIVFLIKSKNRDNLKLANSYAEKIQEYVRTFLKGSLSICSSNVGIFPYDVRNRYQTLIELIKHNAGKYEVDFNTVKDLPNSLKIEHTVNLHEAPTILTLLQAEDWDGAIARISQFLTVNDSKQEHSQDYLFRVLLHLSSSFSSLYVTGDQSIEEHLGVEFHLFMRKRSMITKQRIFAWAEDWIENFKKQKSVHVDDSQMRIIAAVRSYIHENLSEDMSLQTIANKVCLHPVYLSKVYKNMTNETIGDYIYQVRMKRADFLLRNSKLKIADVGNELGFFSQSHFIKVFKKHYGCTPQKYRDRKG
ncbi:response regulator [Bacillus sp. MRMR6]|uniref:response regulator n=1 Tax=Bacillus sp. MRMR6 TaxID=1928617 RepID=UPI00095326E0|nr:response regulator [Bacillus sp. MRMR6]OLS37241.1 hypothetical protein BTR25_16650 [Bacillus sp. MRMR6]